uniref:Regulatory protein zeste n=1 Tax=Ditylenchus dipsaci TaxID=166011 RepID=A0A915CTX9_9BILA
MSSIMRGDQTVQLIQMYHAHYPEIARNTQDNEGRKQRVEMWAKITEDLNSQFATTFSVEQFKKKVQNVQCTSRQKMQNGKKNLGEAEAEYMRLFEQQDRVDNNNCSSALNFDAAHFGFEQSGSRTSSRNGCDMDSPSGEVNSNMKLEQVLEQIAAANASSSNNNGEIKSEICFDHTDADSSTSNQDISTNNGPTLEQLITFATNLNNLSQATNNAEMDGLSNNNSNSQMSTRSHNTLAAKRRRKQAHALHLRNRHGLLLPSSGLELNGGGHLAQPTTSTPNLGHMFGGEQESHEGVQQEPPKWTSDFLDMQRTILDNQRRMLDMMERQANSDHRHNSQTPPSIFTPPSPLPAATVAATTNSHSTTNVPATTTSDSILQLLCSKIDSLANALVGIDATIKNRFPLPAEHTHDE